MDFNNKKVIVCGIGKSGISSCELLQKLGAYVTLQDIKNIDDCNIPEFLLLETNHLKKIELLTGENPSEELLKTMDYMVLSPGIPTTLPFAIKAKELGVTVLGEIELAYANLKAPILAITGTNGKTTTTSLTGEICNSMYEDVFVAGNIGVPLTSKSLEISKNSLVVAEISSFQLETIHDFKPKISAILNLTPDHMDRHKTFENYIEAKKRIFENQDENDFLVLNYDDENCRKIGENIENFTGKMKIVYFSRLQELEQGFYIKGDYIYMDFGDKKGNLVSLADIQIIGSHNLENILASSAISIMAGIDAELVSKRIKQFKGVEHRLEFVRELNGVKFYNDSKGTNPDAAMKAINSIEKENSIVLIGGGYDKNSDFSEWVKLFKNKVKYLVLIGDVADTIADVCKTYDFTNYEKVNTLKDAVNLSYAKCEEGDTLLLSPACASWDMFDDFEQRGELFKEFVNELKN